MLDGRKRIPYTEETEPNPVQAYGESKLAGERMILERNEEALDPRLSSVAVGTLGRWGVSAWVDERLAAGETVPLFTDQWVTPSRAETAASIVLDLVAESATGFVHIASRSCVTPYEFGMKVAEMRGHDTSLITEGSIDGIERPAERPAYSC